MNMMLTLIFQHIFPLISNSFLCFLWSNRSEYHKPVIFLHHLCHSRPIFSLFRHLRHRKPILIQTSIGEQIYQAFWSMDVVLNDNCHNLIWILAQEWFHFLQSVYCRLLQKMQMGTSKTNLQKPLTNFKLVKLVKWKDVYKRSEVVTLPSKWMAEPDVALEIIHIQHQPPHTILTNNHEKKRGQLMISKIFINVYEKKKESISLPNCQEIKHKKGTKYKINHLIVIQLSTSI